MSWRWRLPVAAIPPDARRSPTICRPRAWPLFDFEIDDWADVAFRRGRLVLFVSPKLLKQTSGG